MTTASDGAHAPANESSGNSPPPLLTQGQLAEWLCVTPRALEIWRLKGTGPPFRRIGKGVRYERDRVQAWLDIDCPSVSSTAEEGTS